MTMDNTTSNFCWRLILFSFGVILSAVALPVAKHIWAFTNAQQTSTENLYATYVPVKLKLKPPPPSPTTPGIARTFDVFCCPGGREFDEVSLPCGRGVGVGNLGWGIWLLASISCYIALIPRGVINHGGDKPWCIQSKRYPIRDGLAEKQRLAQVLLCIWRYTRTIYIIFGM